jgi:hypothetical protein
MYSSAVENDSRRSLQPINNRTGVSLRRGSRDAGIPESVTTRYCCLGGGLVVSDGGGVVDPLLLD